MKKSLVILCIMILLVCGCESKENDNAKTTRNTTSISTTTEISTSTSTTTNVIVNEATTVKSSSTTKKTTTKTTTTKSTPTTKKTTACREKKFNKKYTYAYKTNEECMKKGNEAFLDISDNVNKDVFAYNCRLIKDECGTSWYGAYFYVYNQDTHKEEEFYY